MNTQEIPVHQDARFRGAYQDLEDHLRDLERAVRITEILLQHDIEEMGQRQEMLSLLAIDDLKARSKAILDLYYRQYGDGKDEKWEGT